MIAPEPAAGAADSQVAAPTAATATGLVADPVIGRARELSGRTTLTRGESRERHSLILQALSVGGRKHKWLADQIGVSDSLMSRLIKAARQNAGRDCEGVAP